MNFYIIVPFPSTAILPSDKFYSFIIFTLLINAVILPLNCLVLILYIHFVSLRLSFLKINIIWFVISRPARRREIIICTVCACVRACVKQFPLKLLQLHIFGKLVVLMNFFALQYFLGLVNFGLLVSE